MKVMSNAFFWQAEVVQHDRWDSGPLELVFFKERWEDGDGKWRRMVGIHNWNNSLESGFVRPSDALDAVNEIAPGVAKLKNPNVLMVPSNEAKVSQLDVMLMSLLQDNDLARIGVDRKAAIMDMTTVGLDAISEGQAAQGRAAFCKRMWTAMAPQARLDPTAFSSDRSPLRLLSGDARFWMNRIYRLAIDRREQLFEEVEDEPEWESLTELRKKIFSNIDEADRASFRVRRPLMGGYIWNPDNAEDRESILADAINGGGVMESLDPVIELLHTHRTHDDFSSNYSWIKEDFERSFYSKRAKLKVDLVETVDDLPVWTIGENDGYEQTLFRDLLAFLDLKERRLVVALRSGRTVTEIAEKEGLRGHAAVSRRVAALKLKLQKLLL